jgi:hypothetical protein
MGVATERWNGNRIVSKQGDQMSLQKCSQKCGQKPFFVKINT